MRFAVVINDDDKLKFIKAESLGCVSSTTYAWEPGYTAKLIPHNNGKIWGKRYGKNGKKGDTVSIYLDFNNAALSFGINEEIFGVAYDVLIDRPYKVAVQMASTNDEIHLLSYQKIE